MKVRLLLPLLVLALLSLAAPAGWAAGVVTNTNDGGVGSLRKALFTVLDGATIDFDSALNGATIMLSGELEVASSVTIDASSLPDGITLVGGRPAHFLFREER